MIGRGLKGRDFITLRDFSRQEIETMLEVGLQIKGEAKIRRTHHDVLPGRTLLMMFFNPSLRTHNSFEAGIFQLGGHAHFLEPSSARLPTLEGEDVSGDPIEEPAIVTYDHDAPGERQETVF